MGLYTTHTPNIDKVRMHDTCDQNRIQSIVVYVQNNTIGLNAYHDTAYHNIVHNIMTHDIVITSWYFPCNYISIVEYITSW